MQYQLSFPTGTVTYYPEGQFEQLAQLVQPEHAVLITDEHIQNLYGQWLEPYTTIVVPAGEANKTWPGMESIAHELLKKEAHKKTVLVGVGGGAITDITGFMASVYMRGIACGFVPTSLLGMVDAAIGGKNGVNLGWHKNSMGSIRQPEFILYDARFLDTLPQQEWSNGFAEIIKYACLFDSALLDELAQHDLDYYKQYTPAMQAIITQCVDWKNKVVMADEQESGMRKLLNFGHTLAHAIENQYDIPHGAAVGIGSVFACYVSERKLGLAPAVTATLKVTLSQYQLPSHYDIDISKTMELLGMDKKRDHDHIDYVLLHAAGKPEIVPLPISYIQECLEDFQHAGLHSAG